MLVYRLSVHEQIQYLEVYEMYNIMKIIVIHIAATRIPSFK